MDLTDTYRTLHSKTYEYTVFSAPHRTFSKIDHTIGHKANLNRCKKMEITHCILSDHHQLRLDFKNNRTTTTTTTTRKPTYSWKLNNTELN
jgi:exonuclease III